MRMYKYAVLQIAGQHVQQGTPGSEQVYSRHRTERTAENEMLLLSAKHDDRIIEFDIAVLNVRGEYERVSW